MVKKITPEKTIWKEKEKKPTGRVSLLSILEDFLKKRRASIKNPAKKERPPSSRNCCLVKKKPALKKTCGNQNITQKT